MNLSTDDVLYVLSPVAVIKHMHANKQPCSMLCYVRLSLSHFLSIVQFNALSRKVRFLLVVQRQWNTEYICRLVVS